MLFSNKNNSFRQNNITNDPILRIIDCFSDNAVVSKGLPLKYFLCNCLSVHEMGLTERSCI